VFDDSLAHLEGQVQTGEACVGMLERFDHAQGMPIMLEVFAEAAHQAVEFLFARVSEGWMTDVMRRAPMPRSDLRPGPSTPATVRAICETSMVWVSRLRK
jgi:hypothetical protein